MKPHIRPSAWVAVALALLAGWQLLRAPARRKPSPPLPQLAKDVMKTAKSYLPEENPRKPLPVDCSDFVRTVFRAHSVSLPRTAAEMAGQGRGIGARELRMGDLVFFSGSRGGRRVGHVGIAVNKGVFIHVPEGAAGVQLESLHSDYYRKRYLFSRRIIK